MKLYYYEHCPFSTKVRMALGLKHIDAELQVLLYDDVATPEQLVGKKTVPILVKDDGTAMTESLKIVHYLDHLDGMPLIEEVHSHAVTAWIESALPSFQQLGYPRWAQIGLKEMASREAHALFVQKKSQIIGNFDTALSNAQQAIEDTNHRLTLLVEMYGLDPARPQLLLDDINLFPILRGLSATAGLEWPASVRRYVDELSERVQVQTFFSRAC
ncbi:glutaredoxin 2 [Pseudomonas asuensis]|uniref:Glutaredoxin 2 n=1 Tax=Pseudomonas asuensis TaxID=1825787 RepID=A0ABQ2GGF0_9PSED|nr:glutaredoxin 2 [Pseudomonas asuensis]GGL95250.1 glutaredoxin 2 [Pseudomonas asuensis]